MGNIAFRQINFKGIMLKRVGFLFVTLLLMEAVGTKAQVTTASMAG